LRVNHGLLKITEGLPFLILFLILPKLNSFHFSLFVGSAQVAAEPSPQPSPPCGAEPVPTYAAAGDVPVVKSWKESELGADWKPPECAHWTETGFTTLVTTTGRFASAADGSELLRHVGAISSRAGMRYWSNTHKQWRTLILEAHAVTDSPHGQARGDFTTDEMKAGAVFYFEQTDNLMGKATFRMQILEASASRIVFEVENISTMRYAFIPVIRPGEMQGIYFLERESNEVWRYYGMLRTGKNANKRVAGNEASSINRAVAFYRYVAGIPTDQEPPAAR
jgi:hypothetical protein